MEAVRNTGTLSCQDVRFRYPGGEDVIRGVSFRAEGGEAVGLIGANGAGKSTLLKLFVGLGEGYEGSIQVDGLPVTKRAYPEIRRRIGYVFQDSESQLFMTTVAEDVAFAPENYGLPREEVKERVARALRQVHIESLAKKSVYKLSGGEKKLASIATILSMTPEILLMDEPTVALDPGNRRNLIAVVNALPQLKIFASHDLDFVWDTCGRVILLDHGEIAADGPAEGILRDEGLLKAHGLELPLSLTGR